MKNRTKKMRLNKIMLAFATVFFALSLPLIYGWATGQFSIFWTKAGAALFQAVGSAAVCLWGAWIIGEDS